MSTRDQKSKNPDNLSFLGGTKINGAYLNCIATNQAMQGV
uniref:DNA replication protein n=1 Tax=Salmonella dublin TaxID=98360 RepID=Q4L1U6_SALDU|nr:DNA replication protein [Salmonella enterica subsp. enterica serovar Dublin]